MLIIVICQLCVIVYQLLWLEWSYCDEVGEWQLFVNDCLISVYLVNVYGDGVVYYLSCCKDECFYGLGEKVGDLQCIGKCYEMCNFDVMGYNVVSIDLLYKYILFIIIQCSDISYGLFYDNLSSCWLDLGNEIDNYYIVYCCWQVEVGDIDYYLFIGKQVLDVIKVFVCLIGKMLFGFKWSFGYSGFIMYYIDVLDV